VSEQEFVDCLPEWYVRNIARAVGTTQRVARAVIERHVLNMRSGFGSGDTDPPCPICNDSGIMLFPMKWMTLSSTPCTTCGKGSEHIAKIQQIFTESTTYAPRTEPRKRIPYDEVACGLDFWDIGGDADP